jgi:hypothetical protein
MSHGRDGRHGIRQAVSPGSEVTGDVSFPGAYSLRTVGHADFERADQVHSGDNLSTPDSLEPHFKRRRKRQICYARFTFGKYIMGSGALLIG